ncbi:MAG: hypothetical protein M1812_004963 [Candelaria pacifica]|nr:MAG: hypothetical protein M1812_004963 [Candelaria pacifica]
MSTIRGVFPLFLATTFGIINGIAIFGPAFKEQGLEKKGLDPFVFSSILHQNVAAHSSSSNLVHQARAEPRDAQVLKKAEADAVGIDTAEQLPLHVINKSPWSILQFWKQNKAGAHDVALKDSKGVSDRPPNDTKST